VDELQVVSERIRPETLSVVTVAELLTVRSQGDYEVAAKHLGVIKAMQKTVSDSLDPIVAKARASWQATIDLRKEHLDPLVAAEKLVKLRMGEHFERVEAAKRKALEDARIAEEQRLREHAEAEAKALAEADALAATGGDEALEAAQVILDAIPPPPESVPVFYHATPKVQGVSATLLWKAEVTDLRALVAAVAAGVVPITTLEPSAAGLRAHAKATQKVCIAHGVRIYSEQSITARGTR